MNSPWGALFDWDGVIIDSSRHHEKSWELLAKEEGLPLPPDAFRLGFGRKNQIIIPEIYHWSNDPVEIERLGRRKEELYRELMAADALEPLPGVRAWLETLRDAGIPRAVGSSTPRANLDAAMGRLGLGGLFDAIVSAEDVTLGKPNPEVFLKAAARIGCRPERCVVFEDALAGIAAARAGGMRVIGIATTHPVAELGEADLAVRGMAELDLGTLAGWFR
ncbi:MAG: HAD-IA family hydrolase [Chthoniobacteraceae bacterium]|nr:HAD-IA family hydrolase [Chthoniobacteraceae bacterium]